MNSRSRVVPAFFFLLLLLGTLAAVASAEPARKIEVLRIGACANWFVDSQASEKTVQETLRSFIKSETGFSNEIVTQENYEQLADRLAKGQLHLGVFHGHELAWARARHPELRGLAVAVNEHLYLQAHVMIGRDSKAAAFLSLKGQALALPAGNDLYLRVFIERESQLAGLKAEVFFSRITNPTTIEDALDDVVDGLVQVAVAPQLALEKYKRRKPARFAHLKELMHSPAFPAPVVVYQEGAIDQATLVRFQDGLLNAHKKQQGQMLLNLFKLTKYEKPPADYDRVVAETGKAFPPPNREGK